MSFETTPAHRMDIPPFWQRLNKFFLLPLQITPLFYGLALAVSSYLASLSGIVWILIILAISRYAFKIATLSSYGIFSLDEHTPMEEEDGWKYLPWKFVGAVLLQLLALMFVVVRVPELAPLLVLLFAMLLPATIMVLIKERSLASAINPQELWHCVSGVGWPYLILCALTFLLVQGGIMASSLLVGVIASWLLRPGLTFVLAYFSWVNAALIGYTMYQYHHVLGIDIVNEYPGEKDAGTAVSAAAAAREEARQRDALVSHMVRQGQIPGAIVQARQWVHDNDASLADHRRYHRALLLDAESQELQRHAQHFIELLLKNRALSEAIQVYQNCAQKSPEYVPTSAAVTLVLAKEVWKAHDSERALQLLRGFDRRFPKHPLVPEAYALIARVLHQGLGRHEQAAAVLKSLQRHHPHSPHTLDLQRMLQSAPVSGLGHLA